MRSVLYLFLGVVLGLTFPREATKRAPAPVPVYRPVKPAHRETPKAAPHAAPGACHCADADPDEMPADFEGPELI